MTKHMTPVESSSTMMTTTCSPCGSLDYDDDGSELDDDFDPDMQDLCESEADDEYEMNFVPFDKNKKSELEWKLQ